MNLKLEELRKRLLEPLPTPPAPGQPGIGSNGTVYKHSSNELWVNSQRNHTDNSGDPPVETTETEAKAAGTPEHTEAPAEPATLSARELNAAARPDSIAGAILDYVEHTTASGSEGESMEQNSQYQLVHAVAKVFDQTKNFQDRFNELNRMFEPIERLGQTTAKTLGPLRMFEEQLSQLASSFEPVRAFQIQLAQLAQSYEPMKGLEQQLSLLSDAFQAHLARLVKSLEPAKEFQSQLLKVARLFDSASELQRDFAELIVTFGGGPLPSRNRTGAGAQPIQNAMQH